MDNQGVIKSANSRITHNTVKHIAICYCNIGGLIWKKIVKRTYADTRVNTPFPSPNHCPVVDLHAIVTRLVSAE